MKYSEKDITQIKEWIEALYSGEWKQETRELQSAEGYCCLGVACKMFTRKPRLSGSRILGKMPNDQPNAPDWLKEINKVFRRATYQGLTELNDTYRYSFEEIGMALQFVFIESELYKNI